MTGLNENALEAAKVALDELHAHHAAKGSLPGYGIIVPHVIAAYLSSLSPVVAAPVEAVAWMHSFKAPVLGSAGEELTTICSAHIYKPRVGPNTVSITPLYSADRIDTLTAEREEALEAKQAANDEAAEAEDIAVEAITRAETAEAQLEAVTKQAYLLGRAQWCPAGILVDHERTERDWQQARSALSKPEPVKG